MNEIDALMGLGLTDEEKTRILADALRGKQRAADFFALSTVPNIQKAAASKQEAILGSAQQAGLARTRLQEMRSREEEGRKDRESREEQERLNRESYERRAAMTPSGMSRYMGLTRGRDKDGNVVMFGLNPQTQQMDIIPMPEGASITSPMSEAAEANALAKTGERLKGVAALEQQFNEVDAVMRPYLEAGIPVDEIPGLGFFEKMPGVGSVVRGAQDLASEGAPQAEMSQAVRSLMNTIVRNRAGLTQTINEVGRVNAETGMDIMTDPQAFAGAYERIRRAFEADLRIIKASTDPRMWQMISDEAGLEGLTEYPSEGESNPYPTKGEQPISSNGMTPAMIERQRRIDELRARRDALGGSR